MRVLRKAFHGLDDIEQTELIGIQHGAATVDGEAVAGDVDHVDVTGARSNALPDHVAPEVKQERWDRFMEKAQAISEAKLAAKVGHVLQVIVDEVDDEGATCRTMADAPEIDGNLFIDEGFEGLAPGDIVAVTVDEAGEYDLWGSRV